MSIHASSSRGKNGIAWKGVSRGQPCPICEKVDQCRLSEDGNWCNCYRVGQGGTEKVGGDGRTFYVHRLTPRPERSDKWPEPKFKLADGKGELAEPGVLHLVYTKLIEAMHLDTEHKSALLRRKFTIPNAHPRGYRSLGKGRGKAVQELIKADLEKHLPNVPGFVIKEKDGRRYWTLTGWGGLVIPIRNSAGRIVALQVRQDGPDRGGKYKLLSSAGSYNGPGPGSPVHFPVLFDGDKTTCRVTEGVLKADLATVLSGLYTIGLPCVGAWRRAADALREVGATTVRVAFDADAAKNRNVAAALLGVVTDLAEKEFIVELERWAIEDGKGIDDLLAAGKQPEVITGPAVHEAVADIVQQAEEVCSATGSPGGNLPQRAKVALTDGSSNEADDDPHRLARIFLGIDGEQAGTPTLRYWRQEWIEWRGAAYRKVAADEIRARINRRVKQEFDRLNRMELMQYQSRQHGEQDQPPTAIKVKGALESDVYKALAGLARLDGEVDPPAWLGTAGLHSPTEMLVARNALVHLPSLIENKADSQLPLTPDFFSLNALEYPFDAAAPEPKTWLAFLQSLWPNDLESIATLQEWFGYCLLPDVRQGKILLLIGPTRSGKGTIGKVLRALVGESNVTAPTLSSLGMQFGLWPLLGKTLAIIGDARLSGKNDLATIAERLLSISGDDAITVDRKNLPPVTCRLPVRFAVVSNELPRLTDASGALAHRLLILSMTKSWLGEEDHGLDERLLAELPGILLWSIAGWQRLRQRGRFAQPASSQELADEMQDLTSPVSVFVRERCDLGASQHVLRQSLYDAWKAWCDARGQTPGTDATFGRNLRAAFPEIRSTRPREGESRSRHYQGIDLRPPHL